MLWLNLVNHAAGPFTLLPRVFPSRAREQRSKRSADPSPLQSVNVLLHLHRCRRDSESPVSPFPKLSPDTPISDFLICMTITQNQEKVTGPFEVLLWFLATWYVHVKFRSRLYVGTSPSPPLPQPPRTQCGLALFAKSRFQRLRPP